MPYEIRINEKGVPYSLYGNYKGLEIGEQTSVAHTWHKFPKDRSSLPKTWQEAREMMAACADWMLENVVEDNGFSAWEYPYPISYHTSAGWRSSHAQAAGIHLLARSRSVFNNPGYAEPLPNLITAFLVSIRDGGLLDNREKGITWYPKFADPDNDTPRVLNGMLAALLHLHDTSRLIEDGRLAGIVRAGAESVARLLFLYDSGDWSYYNKLGDRASAWYHAVHVKQLRLLAELFQDIEEFREYCDRFRSY